MRNSLPKGGTRIWWSYLGNTYPKCRSGDFLWVPGEAATVAAQLRQGDLAVHEYRRRIVSISRIETAPEFLAALPGTTGTTVEHGMWWSAVSYCDVETPVPLEDLRAELLAIEPPDGPMHAAVGSGTRGDLYPFNRAGLAVVLRATETKLPWTG